MGSSIDQRGKGTRSAARVTRPMLSVVIPMFNAEDLIVEQLAALATQSYDGPWEVVVADNGSRDNSVDAARLWQRRLPSLRIVDASGRQGVSYARNVGAAEASGDFILFIDADDVVAPGWLDAMGEAAVESDFVCGRQEPFIARRGRRRVSGKPRGIQPADGFFFWAFGGNLGVRKEVFTRVRGFREDLHFGEDVDFCWRVQLSGTPLREVGEAVVGYREPSSLLALAKQQFVFGMNGPRLGRDFEAAGVRRKSLRRLASEYFWVATRSPYLALSTKRRRLWVANTAAIFGRLWGVWKWRAFYP